MSELRADRRDARLQRGRDPRDVGEDRRRGTARTGRRLRSRHRRERLDRRHQRDRRLARHVVPRSARRASRRRRLRTGAARRVCSTRTRRGRRQLRHRLLRSRLPRRRGRARRASRTVPRSSSGPSAARARPIRAAPLRKLATAVFSTVLRVAFGLHVSDTHGIKAMRRALGRAVRRACSFGQDLFDTELILRVERAGLRTARDPGRRRGVAAGPHVDRPASAPYTARLGEAAHRVVPGPPRVTALVAARILNGEGGTSATPAWIVIGDGRIVATGSGPPPAGATDLGDARARSRVRRHPGQRRRHRSTSPRGDPPTRSSARSTDSSPAAAPHACRRSAARRSRRIDDMLDRLAVGARPPGPSRCSACISKARFSAARPARTRPSSCATSISSGSIALCDRYGDLIRLVTLAPEADPGFAAIAALRARGIVGRARPQHGRSRRRTGRGRRGCEHRDALVQRHGAAASPRAGPGRRRARRPAARAVADRRRRARSPDDVAPRARAARPTRSS